MSTNRPDVPTGVPAAPPGPAMGPEVPWWNPRSWKQTFSALETPAYARYFWATATFFFAMQMQMLLRGYLIYDLTRDAFSLGLISVTFALPMLVLAPVAGVVADRFDRRTIVVVSQSISLCLTGLTTALILSDLIAFWQLLVISLFSSSVMVFNMPARQAIVPALVGPERLMNALALNSATMNLSRIVAPSLAGVLVAPLGIGGVYVLTMCFNVLAVFLFFNLSVPRLPARPGRPSFMGDMRDGLTYIAGNRLLLVLMLVGTVPMLLAMPHQNLLPVFAVSVWDVGAVGLGLLQTMAGIGGLAGAAIAANLGGVRRQGWLMSASMTLFGVFITFFALSPHFGPALMLVLAGDLCSMIGITVNNTIIQRTTPDAVRGRVMSLMMMTFGITPLGTLPAGWVAQQFGVRIAVAGGGLLLVLFSVLLFTLSRTLRGLDREAIARDVANLRPISRAAGTAAAGD